MPRQKTQPKTVICEECREPFQTTRRAKFCTTGCKISFRRRAEAQGACIIAFAKAFVAGKGGGNTPPHVSAGQCMREFTKIVRVFIDEDRAAGRDPIGYAEGLLMENLYIDRMRRP